VIKSTVKVHGTARERSAVVLAFSTCPSVTTRRPLASSTAKWCEMVFIVHIYIYIYIYIFIVNYLLTEERH